MTSFEICNDELCISVTALAEAMGIKLKSALNTIWKGLKCNRKGAASYRHYPDPADNRRKWIAVESLPTTTRERVDYHYGNLWHRFYAERFTAKAAEYVTDGDFGFFAGNGFKKNGKPYSADEARQLALGCGWLRMLSAQWNYEFFKTKAAYYGSAAQVIYPLDLYGLKVKNWRVLGRRVKAWDADGRSSMVSKLVGNSNRTKLTDIGVKFLLHLYSSPLKPSAKAVTKIYNDSANERGWEKITVARVRQILNEPQNRQLVFASRHGVNEDRKAHERTIKRRRPSFPDALWSFDGFTVQLRYFDADGKVRSGLYGVGILDVHSDCLLGYAIGDGETGVLVQAALRDASRKTGMRPYQLQYDNSSANKSNEVTELMDKLSHLNFPSAPYNGKAKPIENWIGRMERLNLRHFPNFKGGNITSPSLTIKANPDFLAAQTKAGTLPDKAGAIAQFIRAVAVQNATRGTDGKTPTERYQMQHEKRKKIDYFTMVEAFWVERRRKARYTKDGLVIEIEKTRYTYEVESEKGIEDFEFRNRYLGDSFTVKYDPDDITDINLYQDGVWIATATRKYETPMAVADFEEGEGQLVRAAQDERKRIEAVQAARLAATRSELENEGALVELSHELLHKDAYNATEGQLLDEVLDRGARVSGLTMPQRRKAVTSLYDVEGEADGRLIE